MDILSLSISVLVSYYVRGCRAALELHQLELKYRRLDSGTAANLLRIWVVLYFVSQTSSYHIV